MGTTLLSPLGRLSLLHVNIAKRHCCSSNPQQNMLKQGIINSYTVSVSHEPRTIGYSNTYIDHMAEVKGQANNLSALCATLDVAKGQSSCSYCLRPSGRLPVLCKGVSLPRVGLRKAVDPVHLRTVSMLRSTSASCTINAGADRRGRCGLAGATD